MSMTPCYSSIWFSLLALGGGLALLVAGGELLVSGAAKLAKRWGMSPLHIGLTVVAFGTSTPELFVSLAATLQGYPDVMVGNVVGSNIANIGLVLACAALLYPLRVKFSLLIQELGLVVLVSLLVMGIAATGGFNRLWGGLFVAGLVAYTALAFRREAGNRESNSPAESAAHSYPYIAGFIVGGLLMLGWGSNLFIDGAVDVARHFGISELVIGLTLAAVGTSLPELASSISAIRRREGYLLVGNVVGSNLFNLMMVMGATALVTPFSISSEALMRDLPVMTGFSAVLIAFLYFGQRLNRVHGLLLLAGYGGYLFLLAG